MVGPGGGDFAPSLSTAGGKMGGGKSIVTGKKSSVSEKVRGPQKKMTKKRLEDATEKIKDDYGRERMKRWKKANLPNADFQEWMKTPYEQRQLKNMRSAVSKVKSNNK